MVFSKCVLYVFLQGFLLKTIVPKWIGTVVDSAGQRLSMKRFVRRDNTRYGKRHVPGQMNLTEAAYAETLLLRKMASEIIDWQFEAITFKLAPDCRYTPDFAIWMADGTMEFVDCKGGGPMDEKSRVKAKVAAERYPMFVFVIEQKKAKKDGGGWKREVF